MNRSETHEVGFPCPNKPFFVVTIFDVASSRCGGCGRRFQSKPGVYDRAQREVAALRLGVAAVPEENQ